jgi:hypothetical protein
VHLVQVLLPLCDNAKQPLPLDLFEGVANELTQRFGGLTAYSRAPAEGLWRRRQEETSRDEIVVYEVMVEELDTEWWRAYRERLETRFRQEQVVARAQEIRLL